MKIDFKDGAQAKQLRLAKANFDKTFVPGEGPWEVTEEEWKFIQKFKVFEQCKQGKAASRKKIETEIVEIVQPSDKTQDKEIEDGDSNGT